MLDHVGEVAEDAEASRFHLQACVHLEHLPIAFHADLELVEGRSPETHVVADEMVDVAW